MASFVAILDTYRAGGSMNVSLPDELRSWIDERVNSGLYRSSSEVVREALRIMREREEEKELRRRQLRLLLEEAESDVAAGRVRAFDDSVLNEIGERGRAQLEQER